MARDVLNFLRFVSSTISFIAVLIIVFSPEVRGEYSVVAAVCMLNVILMEIVEFRIQVIQAIKNANTG